MNPNGSIYHLNLVPEQVAKTIITVGDPDRVRAVSKHFDKIDHQVQKREFITHTGWIGKKRLTVISTGIGTGNIDIVVNELDALFNIDLKNREIKEQITQLDFIRIGTSGCLVKTIPIGSFLVSSFAIGLDNLLNYYAFKKSKATKDLQQCLKNHLKTIKSKIRRIPYIFEGNPFLINSLGQELKQGITLTCPGFYGPQGRQIRAKNSVPGLLDHFLSFNQQNYFFEKKGKRLNWQISNFEMETASIYGMANLLGHRAISFNALLANRATGQFSKQPKKTVENLINLVLERLHKDLPIH